MIKEYQKLSDFLINKELVKGYTLGHSSNNGKDALKYDVIILHSSRAAQLMATGVKYDRIYEIEFPLAAVKSMRDEFAQIMYVTADLEKARVTKEYFMEAGKVVTK